MKATGLASWTHPEGRTVEHPTFTCAHCNRVVIVRPRAPAHEVGGFCRMCMANICSACERLGKCVPFEKKLDALERRDRLLAR